ncbi:2Fe-2S iron-sulfur cluster-binding protein [Sphingomonas sp. SRS2]|uniref:2Fe-2S iron-sulfur cluster-binding protein n=1 Tax=Sphingomonas sp. SRS2 TaxID=133190 RepID=UPI001F480998|nr:2Fe-2S iron-sulfur cluster-binding protein [Sphingomonas sp. SRS2]
MLADQRVVQVRAEAGDSVMHVALMQEVEGILGECGGGMMCGTCHCYVGDEWVDAVGPACADEADLLEGAMAEILPSSRLSCRILLSQALDGLVVRIPQTQG